MLLGENKRAEKIRVDRITHDIAVLDVLLYFMEKYKVGINSIITEKEMHMKDGFSVRKHYPDFILLHNDKTCAVEIELNPKARETMEKNIKSNYLAYDKQVWVTNNNKVNSLLEDFTKAYSNIMVLDMEDVRGEQS